MSKELALHEIEACQHIVARELQTYASVSRTAARKRLHKREVEIAAKLLTKLESVVAEMGEGETVARVHLSRHAIKLLIKLVHQRMEVLTNLVIPEYTQRLQSTHKDVYKEYLEKTKSFYNMLNGTYHALEAML